MNTTGIILLVTGGVLLCAVIGWAVVRHAKKKQHEASSAATRARAPTPAATRAVKTVSISDARRVTAPRPAKKTEPRRSGRAGGGAGYSSSTTSDPYSGVYVYDSSTDYVSHRDHGHHCHSGGFGGGYSGDYGGGDSGGGGGGGDSGGGGDGGGGGGGGGD